MGSFFSIRATNKLFFPFLLVTTLTIRFVLVQMGEVKTVQRKDKILFFMELLEVVFLEALNSFKALFTLSFHTFKVGYIIFPLFCKPHLAYYFYVLYISFINDLNFFGIE